MRKFIAAALAVAIASIASVAQGDEKQPSPPADQNQGYPYAWRQNFIEGCMAGEHGAPRPVCECGIRNIERNVPFADSQALDSAAAAGRNPDPRTIDQYRQAMRLCIQDPTA